MRVLRGSFLLAHWLSALCAYSSLLAALCLIVFLRFNCSLLTDHSSFLSVYFSLFIAHCLPLSAKQFFWLSLLSAYFSLPPL
jgi:hypothetical protein